MDYRLFWRILRGRKPKQKHNCTKIIVDNKIYIDEHIANGFGEYFSQVFKDSSDSNPLFNENICNQLDTFLKKDTGDFKYILEREVTSHELSQIIKHLKTRKCPGYDNILNEHIINGSSSLHKMICLLFNSIFSSERTPEI